MCWTVALLQGKGFQSLVANNNILIIILMRPILLTANTMVALSVCQAPFKAFRVQELNFHSKSMRQIEFISPLHGSQNVGTERLSNLHKVTQSQQ